MLEAISRESRLIYCVLPQDIAAVGVTNQRETTIVWDKRTGEPLYNAVVWLDVRTSSTIDALVETLPEKNRNHYQSVCGLPLSTYFSGVKLRWLKDNVPAVAQAIQDDVCLFGTVDTWLLWNLTGGKNGGVHITDVTNASRTMLMNIRSRLWDADLCEFFDISPNVLPEIRSSSEVYGTFAKGPLQVCLCNWASLSGRENILLLNTSASFSFRFRAVRCLAAWVINKPL